MEPSENHSDVPMTPTLHLGGTDELELNEAAANRFIGVLNDVQEADTFTAKEKIIKAFLRNEAAALFASKTPDEKDDLVARMIHGHAGIKRAVRDLMAKFSEKERFEATDPVSRRREFIPTAVKENAVAPVAPSRFAMPANAVPLRKKKPDMNSFKPVEPDVKPAARIEQDVTPAKPIKPATVVEVRKADTAESPPLAIPDTLNAAIHTVISGHTFVQGADDVRKDLRSMLPPVESIAAAAKSGYITKAMAGGLLNGDIMNGARDFIVQSELLYEHLTRAREEGDQEILSSLLVFSRAAQTILLNFAKTIATKQENEMIVCAQSQTVHRVNPLNNKNTLSYPAVDILAGTVQPQIGPDGFFDVTDRFIRLKFGTRNALIGKLLKENAALNTQAVKDSLAGQPSLKAISPRGLIDCYAARTIAAFRNGQSTNGKH